jgi:drug/metabolite transporter (DMT)-like permease
MSDHTRGLLIGFAAVLLFGFTVVMQAFLVEEGIRPFAAVGIRYAISGLVCLVIVLGMRRPALPVRGERLSAILLGAIAYGLQAVLFYGALEHGTVASVSLLFYTYPVLVLVASLVLRLRAWAWLAGASALMSAMGAALVVAAGREVTIDGTGVAMALGSSACVMVFLLANSRLIPRTPALAAAAWVSFGVAASTLSLALILGELEGELEALNLHEVFGFTGRAQVAEDSDYLSLAGGNCLRGLGQQLRPLVGARTVAAEAGVDLEVKVCGLTRGFGGGNGSVKLFEVGDAEVDIVGNGCHKVVFWVVQPGEHCRGNASLTKNQTLGNIGNRKAAATGSLENLGNLDHSVAVGVCLDHRQQRCIGAGEHRLVVVNDCF